MASEREADAKLRDSVQNLHTQRASLVQRTTSLTGELAEIRAQIEARRAHKQEKAARLREQACRNAPELMALQQCTGLAIEASEHEGVLRFIFSLLAPNAAPCTLDVDVSQSEYTVPYHDPRLSETKVRGLVRQLNAHGDFYAFLKALRAALQEAVKE